jgi:hypothetical protein
VPEAACRKITGTPEPPVSSYHKSTPGKVR